MGKYASENGALRAGRALTSTRDNSKAVQKCVLQESEGGNQGVVKFQLSQAYQPSAKTLLLSKETSWCSKHSHVIAVATRISKAQNQSVMGMLT